MQSKDRPRLPRSLSPFGWPSDDSTGSLASYDSGKAVLIRCPSRVSLTTWRSGNSSDTHMSSKRNDTVRVILKTMKSKVVSSTMSHGWGEGDRQICFQNDTIVVTPETINLVSGGRPNKVHTARFTPLTWLPKSLFQQFRRVANIYFLVIVVTIMALHSFGISPKDWKSKVFPFLLVLLWTALKDLHEDTRRRRDDAIENNQKVLRFDIGKKTFVDTAWQDICVGDVLLVECNNAFPADMILLFSSGGPEAFISTISLDGETNLKQRRAPPMCDKFKLVTELVNRSGASSDAIQDDVYLLRRAAETSLHILHHMHSQYFSLTIGKPDVNVTDVKGSVNMVTATEDCPISLVHFLPRGCVLRNTPWVLAQVVFAGDETKTRLNMARSKGKMSNMQKYLNICVWGLLIGLLVLCIYASIMSILQEGDIEFPGVICCGESSFTARFAIFTITFYHVVPMSLYVCFEMLKLLLGWQVNNDPQMCDPETGVKAVARTADIIEEMGQINFVFSDKTGTLTKNEMVFASACVSGKDIGDFRRGNSQEEPAAVAKIREGLANKSLAHRKTWKDLNWFFTCLACCHSVQVSRIKEVGKEEQIVYHGVSPDEVSLVYGAQQVGITFSARTFCSESKHSGSSTSSEVTLVGADESTKVFSILHELEFNSDRKRMSVIMRLGSQVYLITKGADSVMEGLLTQPFSEAYKRHLKQFSQLGLRTLVFGFKKVDRHFYRKWEKTYKELQSLTSSNKDEEVAAQQALLEQGLTLVGITAVEDRLQDGVPQAIATIKEAGVKVWVLTGDKTETAVDIAYSCQLFTEETTLAYAINCSSEEESLQALKEAREKLAGCDNGGLVLDGVTIRFCLTNPESRQLIYQLGIACRSCVCCRLTPLQKRNLIDIVIEADPGVITLAIGDGANDVPMIEGAHLGIGVHGREGAQAVQVSEVAISQFRFLVPLLLCHGRRAYHRIALFLCYYLYKNVALLMGDVVWMHMDSYRGRIAFPEYLSINYNVFFTSWHILFILGFDLDVPDEVANCHPDLYLVGPRRKLFNKTVFSRWMAAAVYHGIAAWSIPAAWIIDGAVYDKASPGRFWEGSITAFTTIMFVVMLKLLLHSQNPLNLRTSILPTLGAILCYVVIFCCLAYVPLGVSLQPSMEGLPGDIVKNTQALIAMVTVPLAIILVDVVVVFIQSTFHPTPLDTVRARLRKGQLDEVLAEGREKLGSKEHTGRVSGSERKASVDEDGAADHFEGSITHATAFSGEDPAIDQEFNNV